MNPVAISALAALGGSAVGALAPVLSNVLVQRSAARRDLANQKITTREALYSDFMKEASHLYVTSLSQTLEDAGDLVSLYTFVSRIRLRSTEPVLRAADEVVKEIIKNFVEPNLAIEQIRTELISAIQGQSISVTTNPLYAFSLACRKELDDVLRSAF